MSLSRLKKPWSPTPALLRAATRPALPTHLTTRNNTPIHHRSLITLAIESSCDDACVAVLEKNGPSARLVFNEKVTADNSKYRGIHPNETVAFHIKSIAPLVRKAIKFLPNYKPDFVTVTRGPGMMPALSAGLSTAKGLALAWNVPILGVNHMQAHALTPRLVAALDTPLGSTKPLSPNFMFMTLLVSGGHTMLVRSNAVANHSILAQAEFIAVGDVLDKVARAILTPDLIEKWSRGDPNTVAYAPLLEKFACSPSPNDPSEEKYSWYTPPATREAELVTHVARSGRWELQPPLSQSREMKFDFSQLNRDGQALAKLFPLQLDESKSAELREYEELEERRQMGRGVMKIAFEHLASRIIFALVKEYKDLKGRTRRNAGEMRALPTLVVSGGVASNKFLMHVLRSILDARGFEGVSIVAPPPELCTDNAAMIAWAGMEMYEQGWRTKDDVIALRKWPIDPAEEGGILGVDGWYRGRVKHLVQ